MHCSLFNGLQLVNCIFCFDVFWPHWVFLCAGQARTTNSFPSNYRRLCLFPDQQAPCLCGNNQRERRLQGFFFFLVCSHFSMAAFCCLVLGYSMPGNSSRCIIFSTHSSISTQRSILCADTERKGLLPSLTKEASV